MTLKIRKKNRKRKKNGEENNAFNFPEDALRNAFKRPFVFWLIIFWSCRCQEMFRIILDFFLYPHSGSHFIKVLFFATIMCIVKFTIKCVTKCRHKMLYSIEYNENNLPKKDIEVIFWTSWDFRGKTFYWRFFWKFCQHLHKI